MASASRPHHRSLAGTRRGWKPAPPTAPAALSGSQTVKKVIEVTDLPTHRFDAESARIVECEYLASYNLLERGSNEILVPGLPARWTPVSGEAILSEDSGDYYRDENAARFPAHAMEPAVRSLFTMVPDISAASIDVFACGSTLGNLLRFVRGKAKPFSFVVHVVGNTAFLLRRERSPTQLIDDIHGYGQTFLERFTSWDPSTRGSASHQRVIKYDFGGKRLLLRFETDAYLRREIRVDESRAARASDTTVDGAAREADPLEDALFKINVSHRPGAQPSTRGPIRVSQAGHVIPQHAVADIKTRSHRKQEADILEDELPRLWLRQIPWFILAFHHHGHFDDVSVKDISGRLRQWESENAVHLRRLAALIDDIVKCAKDTEAGKLEVRGSDKTVELRDLSKLDKSTWAALPDDLAALWE